MGTGTLLDQLTIISAITLETLTTPLLILAEVIGVKPYNWQETRDTALAEGEARGMVQGEARGVARGELNMLRMLFVNNSITSEVAYTSLLSICSKAEADALFAEWTQEVGK